jgi:hypothetical protein
VSLFRSSAWGALSPQRSLPLAPAGTPAPQASRQTLPRARATGLAPARGAEGGARAIPAVLAREPSDGR